MKATAEIIEYWQQQVRGYQESGVSRREYCQQHQIPIHRLGYWQRKLKKQAIRSLEKKRMGWIPLQLCEEDPSNRDTGIRLRIGRVIVEVERGFDRQLLAEVLEVVGAAC